MANKGDGTAAAIAVIVIWIFSALLSLAFTGVIIWGIIELIQWLTSQSI